MSILFNQKFVRKIQMAFLLIAGVAAIIVVNDFIQLKKTANSKDQLFAEFIQPKIVMDEIYTQFNQLQFELLKFSIPSFESDLEKNIEATKKYKESIDTELDKLLAYKLSDDIINNLKEVQTQWTNYKNVVADAILSAGVTKNYEMAAIISVTSGAEVGTQLKEKFELCNKILTAKSEVISEEVNSSISTSTLFIIIGMFIGTVVFLFSAFKVAPALSGPLNKMKDVIGQFAVGNFDAPIEIHTKDEFGELADALRELRTAQQEKIKAALNIAKGNFVMLESNSEQDKLVEALNTVVNTLQNLGDELNQLTNASVEGDLTRRGDLVKFEGSYKEIVSGFNSILDAVIMPVKEGSVVLEEMASGNLTTRVKGEYKGDHQIIIKSINTVADSLQKALTDVSEAVQSTATAASQISSSTEELASGSQEQSSQTTDIAGAIEQMSKTIIETTKNTGIAAETARLAGSKAIEGGKVIKSTIAGMDKIAFVVKKSADTVFALGKNSDKIGEIVQVIDDIADQTNLLALNAAIEAARAGEQGRGFAVVADEVRKLAERTTKATKEIASMIKQIQKDTSEAVSSMEEGTKEVEEGKILVNKSGQVLEEIIDGNERLTDIVTQVAAASEQQSASAEQISRNIESISAITQESTSGIQQIAKAAENLGQLTTNLQDLVNLFKLNSNGHYTGTKRKLIKA